MHFQHILSELKNEGMSPWPDECFLCVASLTSLSSAGSLKLYKEKKKKMGIIVMVISVHGFEQTHVHIHPHNDSAVLGI